MRNGLNFTERGFGVRGALGVSDRGHSAASQLRPARSTGTTCSASVGVRWLHTGGIFAALSESAAAVADRGDERGPASTARSSPTTSTTGPSLWDGVGGVEARPRGQP